MARKSIREAAAEQRPLVTPLAHDALTARMIAKAGFKAMGIGGSAMLAARYGLPDIGIAALGEMAAGTKDIMDASDLPIVVDGDDGYGDIKSVARMTDTYVRMGVGAIVLEDQERSEKRPGDAKASSVASIPAMQEKIRVAVSRCQGSETMIIARSDAYGLEGLDGILRRAEDYVEAGAAGFLVVGVTNLDELEQIGRRLGHVHLATPIFEGRPNWRPPAEYGEMGFRQVMYPGLLITRVVDALERGLEGLGGFAQGKSLEPLERRVPAAELLAEIVGLADWQGLRS
ncbi:isocitrate lyase/PEP mutase family protein [Bosea sp. BK604]|uniref:isocitrate lyase/PEP mutase family protein n=1 Tax=Bosea sp. BK604 TaxID=2512180 RepID=UPI0010E67DB8|nr:isocitrate lyase/PEP mutase family protein [Bosea sp. BK604]TCR70657.1 methylisocitrate lyase [Bosea sp. BK604]